MLRIRDVYPRIRIFPSQKPGQEGTECRIRNEEFKGIVKWQGRGVVSDRHIMPLRFRQFIGSKTTIYLSLGLHKERPSYRRSLQLSTEVIQHFKTWTFKFLSSFVGHFCPPGSTDPIESGSDPDTDPDPQPIFWQISNSKWGVTESRVVRLWKQNRVARYVQIFAIRSASVRHSHYRGISRSGSRTQGSKKAQNSIMPDPNP